VSITERKQAMTVWEGWVWYWKFGHR